jgi:hypothetical protein
LAKKKPETCNGVEATIVGTNGDDVINGTDGDDVIVGKAAQPSGSGWLVAHLSAAPPFFLARGCGRPEEGRLRLSRHEAEQLRLGPGDRVWALPLA